MGWLCGTRAADERWMWRFVSGTLLRLSTELCMGLGIWQIPAASTLLWFLCEGQGGRCWLLLPLRVGPSIGRGEWAVLHDPNVGVRGVLLKAQRRVLTFL